jgi:hypothetical protein
MIFSKIEIVKPSYHNKMQGVNKIFRACPSPLIFVLGMMLGLGAGTAARFPGALAGNSALIRETIRFP